MTEKYTSISCKNSTKKTLENYISGKMTWDEALNDLVKKSKAYDELYFKHIETDKKLKECLKKFDDLEKE